MKIGLDVQSLFEEKKTGIGWTVKMLVEKIICNDADLYHLNYFAFRDKKSKKEHMLIYKRNNTIVQCCNWMPLGLYRRIWNFIRIPYSLFFKEKADVTIFFNYFIPPGVKGKKIVFIYDMVWKACPQTMDMKTKQFMDKNTEWAFRQADMIVTVSEFSKSEIVKYMGIQPEKIGVVLGGVDFDRYNPNYPVDDIINAKKKFGIDGEYFLYLGTLEPRKNIICLVEAYAMFVNEHSNAPYLVISGKKGWQYEEIFEKIHSYGIENQVIFTGYVEDSLVPLLISGALAFVFPSLYEGFGLPPLEAMACGIPVIVSNVASLPEVVGEAGIKISPDSPEEIKDAMIQLVEIPDLRRKMSTMGIERSKKFSWENNAKQLYSICKGLVEIDELRKGIDSL